jgi:Ca-activated chloride channel family protein
MSQPVSPTDKSQQSAFPSDKTQRSVIPSEDQLRSWIIEPSFRPKASAESEGLGALLALVEGAERPLPLREVRVRSQIAGPICHSIVEQRFANALDRPMEAIYLFPLPPRAALIDFVLRAGDLELRAECREREAAQAAYEEARRLGQRSALLERERSDLHAIRVANLPPGAEVTVRLELIEELKSIDGRWEWRFPTVIAPRFLPGTPIGQSGAGTLPDSDRVPDGSRLQPPLLLKGGTTLDLEVEIAGPLRNLAAAQHATVVHLPGGAEAGIRIAPEGRAQLDRDFVLRFETAAEDRPRLSAWTDGRYCLALVEPPALDSGPSLPRDAVFVLDRSGSMAGAKMDAAKLALSLALHGLAPGDRFMLLAFDNQLDRFAWGKNQPSTASQSLAASEFELHSDAFVAYDQASLDAADSWVDRIEARGGTEMLPAIQAALGGSTPEGRLRTVLFITDGQAWNEDELVAAVTHRRGRARFFSLGIDSAVNAGLLEGLARAGGGTCELLAPGDDIEAAVARFESRFGSPLVDGIRFDGVEAADPEALTLFAGRPAMAILEGAPARLQMRGSSAEGIFEASAQPQRVDRSLGPLWARRRIDHLEVRLAAHPHEAEGLRAEMLRLALDSGLPSRYTAWVVVDPSAVVAGEPLTVVQPVSLPHGWEDPDRAAHGRRIHGLPSGAIASPPSPSYTMAEADTASEYGDRAELDLYSDLAAEGSEESISILRAIGYPLPTGARKQLRRKQGPVSSSRSEPSASRDPLADLLRKQRADGSFGSGLAGDAELTAAALVALVLAGNSRRSGLRRRAVIKAARWLEGMRGPGLVDLALSLLARADAGEPATVLRAELARGTGAMGARLDALLARLGQPGAGPAMA